MTEATEGASVLITGATGAIGTALALEYAAPGVTLWLHGRKTAQLDALATACGARGAVVHTRAIDVRDLDALSGWLAEVCSQGAPDLAIVGAGVNINIGEQRAESWDEMQMLLDVNIRGSLATVNAIAPGMRLRGSGQIALLSSLAAYRGLPMVPSYCASKAALKAYGEAMREVLAADGVRMNVVMPGYVDSPMSRAMPGPKPFLWTAEKSARAIRRGLHANRARIAFPFPLSFGTWLLSVIPPSWSAHILRWLKYGG